MTWAWSGTRSAEGSAGWPRKHGLSSSSVLAAEVVTADGEVVRADADTNPDLFWALRGGGGGVGVVTEIEIALYPVTEAFAGWLAWPVERAGEVLGAWAEWTRGAPDEVTSVGRLLQVPPSPHVPEPLRGRQLAVVEAAHLGDEPSGRELLRPLLELGPELDTFAMVPARGLTELHRDPPGPAPGRGAGWMLDALDPAAARAIVDAAAMDGTAPLVSLEIRHLGGALGRPDPNGGALTHLEPPYVMQSVGIPTDAEAVAKIDERIAVVREATEPWRSRRAFLNFAERGVDPDAFHAPGIRRRLEALRAELDPDGMFRPKPATG